MSSFRRFVEILVPLFFVLYGILLFIQPDRYTVGLPPVVTSAIGFFMMAFGAWLYMRDRDEF